MINDLLYFIPKEKLSKENIVNLLNSHPEIKFVSTLSVDLYGNDTDSKIPVSLFLKNIDKFMSTYIAQTDGSSVVLPLIATLNNAKLDMVIDTLVNWFVDYNYQFKIDINGELKPVGTLLIPCFLMHNNKYVDSRSILKRASKFFKETLFDLFKDNPDVLCEFDIDYDDISDIDITCATEFEFWVKTPNENIEIEALTTSQMLKEQYWNRTRGSVRCALEESLLLMEKYGLEPEMGHKEVGGVRAKLCDNGDLDGIVEQLEIDWKFTCDLECADNEIFVRQLVREVFRKNALDVSIKSKPFDGVAGSGEHLHIGIALKLKNGKTVNLFSPKNKRYLTPMGFGSLMGILKNYEVIDPFVAPSIDALKRLKPGFEAPVSIVTSLGMSPFAPSRNRTVLIGLIRDMVDPLATRFELRSPCARSNTYLVIASTLMAMIDGIRYAILNHKSQDELLSEISKEYGEESDYLEKNRCYRTELNIFEDYTEEERNKLFGIPPYTVYENISNFEKLDKLKVLFNGDVFNEALINSYKEAVLNVWLTELDKKVIPDYSEMVRKSIKLHDPNKACDLDVSNWAKIKDLRYSLMKDTIDNKSLFTKIRDHIHRGEIKETSAMIKEIDLKMNELNEIYLAYKKNLIDI